MKLSRALLLVMASFLLATAPAVADTITFNIWAVNNPGGDVFDVHVVIVGTGGSLGNLVAVTPLEQTFDVAPITNEFNASWGLALGDGGTWKAKFDVVDVDP